MTTITRRAFLGGLGAAAVGLWHLVYLTTYLGVGLAFGHQLAGHEKKPGPGRVRARKGVGERARRVVQKACRRRRNRRSAET